MDAIPPDGEADILPFQPLPKLVIVARLRQGPYHSTSISRGWHDGHERSCRLCGQCTAEMGQCLVSVPWYVPDESAALFSFRDGGEPCGRRENLAAR